MFNSYWRKRALEAESKLAAMGESFADLQKSIEETCSRALADVEATKKELTNRTRLVSLTVHGKTIRFIFMRNGETHFVETYRSWDLNYDEIRRVLLDDIKTEG